MGEAWRHLNFPAVVAHRGYAARYPENTIVALAAAVSGGARFLEFDVQLSRDEVPVLCHDESLSRVANRAERVFDLDWSELRGVRAGETQRFGERFARLPLASLRDTVAHLNDWPQTVSFVEIKRQSVERFGVACTVERVLAEMAGARWPFVIISFDAAVVEYAQRRGCPQTGWVLREWDTKHRSRLRNLSPAYVFCNADKIPGDEPLWQGGWLWVIYEVRTAVQAEYWRGRGAAMVESMTPVDLLGAAPFARTGTTIG